MPIENDGRHISTIMESTTCRKHSAGEDEPCYQVHQGAVAGAPLLFGVCGNRIKRAGFTGRVSLLSMTLKSGGRSGRKSPK